MTSTSADDYHEVTKPLAHLESPEGEPMDY